jgi:hypothetical protein
MDEVTFVIEGKGKKGADSSLIDITFTSIKIGDTGPELISDDKGPDHKSAKDALTKLLSNADGPKIEEIDGGSSHRRKSYKKEKKIKGGKRKSLRRHKYV